MRTVLYVALTRAQRRLIIVQDSSKRFEGVFRSKTDLLPPARNAFVDDSPVVQHVQYMTLKPPMELSRKIESLNTYARSDLNAEIRISIMEHGGERIELTQAESLLVATKLMSVLGSNEHVDIVTRWAKRGDKREPASQLYARLDDDNCHIATPAILEKISQIGSDVDEWSLNDWRTIIEISKTFMFGHVVPDWKNTPESIKAVFDRKSSLEDLYPECLKESFFEKAGFDRPLFGNEGSLYLPIYEYIESAHRLSDIILAAALGHVHSKKSVTIHYLCTNICVEAKWSAQFPVVLKRSFK
jgi:hypothetical protein